MTRQAESKAASMCLCVEQCAVACVCESAEHAPCVQLALAYSETTQLCDQLESIADSLPYHVDRMTCLDVAGRLLPLLRESHQYEEGILFPVFESDSHPARKATVRRLKSEHVYDEGAAEEICERLTWIGQGEEIDNPEALGFMLRAFFETLRRHIAFEREYVLPSTIAAPLLDAQGNA